MKKKRKPSAAETARRIVARHTGDGAWAAEDGVMERAIARAIRAATKGSPRG